MPTTAILIKGKDEKETRLKFMTLFRDGFLDIEVHLCDEEFIPFGNTSRSMDKITDEEYHKKLRKEASDKGHFVPEESTNPEWNPEKKQD